MVKLHLPIIGLLALITACDHHDRGDRSTLAADSTELTTARAIDEVEELIAAGDTTLANLRAEALLGRGIEHPRLFLLLGRAAVEEEDHQAASDLFHRAIAHAPSWIEPRLELARCYLEMDRLAAADSVFRDLDHLAPEHPGGPSGRGWVALMQGRNDEAQTHLQEALLRDPNYANALLGSSQLAQARGDLQVEERLLRSYLVGRPTDPAVYRRLAAIADAKRRPQEALALLERSYELQPDHAIARDILRRHRERGATAAIERWRVLASEEPQIDSPPDNLTTQ